MTSPRQLNLSSHLNLALSRVPRTLEDAPNQGTLTLAPPAFVGREKSTRRKAVLVATTVIGFAALATAKTVRPLLEKTCAAFEVHILIGLENNKARYSVAGVTLSAALPSSLEHVMPATKVITTAI